ncbi:McrC family protein [Paenibacillus sp. GYB004]|uniref:McrC family protein n=1 Tax=Paenibacillus sp. GYB004 TaxID=2994393 RepID=UPI002F963149
MSNKNGKCTTVTMKEYGSLCKNADGISLGYQCLAESTFDRLEQFILENRGGKDAAEPLEFMTLSSRRGIGKVISAKNHVGVIAMQDGTQIEILPKLYSRDEESSNTQTKSIFIQMLRSIQDIPNKQFSPTSLQAEKNNILNIFIRMFIEETITLVKRGLKSDYREHRDNEFFYKGKLQVAQHIKHNAAHKERFYIEYDEYSVNRPENRLIKTTIELLLRISGSADNQKDLYSLLAAFDNIETSGQLEQDWASISTDRSMKDYQTILEWCRLFLSGQSFTPFKGESLAYALLFPMEKVFEGYVAGLIKKVLVHRHVQIKAQDRTYRLFHNPARFQLKPDIVVQGPSGVVILDTKWKLLSTAPDYGISQSDMYQAYAYGKKYGATKVYLLYPWLPQLSMIKQPVGYESGDGVEVHVTFLDLSLGKACVDALSVELLNTALGND